MYSPKKLFTLCSELIAIPTISDVVPETDMGNLPLLNHLATRLEDLGMTCDIHLLDGRSDKGNLFAYFGQTRPELVFSGHADTVPYNNQWQSDPFRLSNQQDLHWQGLGICDMKVLFPMFMSAIEPLLQTNQAPPIGLLVTADEETSMDGARAILKQDYFTPKQIIIGEPTNQKPVYAHKGYMAYRAKATGSGGHSSDPSAGYSAIEIMHTFIASLLQLKQQFQDDYFSPDFAVPYPTLNLGRVLGGKNLNTISEQCLLEFEIRPTPNSPPEQLHQQLMVLSQQIEQAFPEHFDIAPLFANVPGFCCASHSKLKGSLEKHCSQSSTSVNFTTEAGLFAQKNIEVMVLGPGDIKEAHQPNEKISTNAIQRMTQTYHNYMVEFLKVR